MSTYLIVISKVPYHLFEAFDEWYKNKHLIEAHKSFGSLRLFRGWVNNNEHHAFL